jgi:quercetin dioxygenase-like cupin family protein
MRLPDGPRAPHPKPLDGRVRAVFYREKSILDRETTAAGGDRVSEHTGIGGDGVVATSDRTEETSGSVIMDPDAYFSRMVPTDTKPGVWRWDDIENVLNEMDKIPKRYPAYRRFAALVNQQWEGAPGASPLIFVGVQRIHAGEELPGHRHNSVAIYYWISGSGYAVVDDTVIRFKAGDFFTCPAWHDHSFVNDGDEDMTMIAVHDLPILAQARALFWQEPIGDENTQHLVRERAGSWSAQESREVAEAAPNIVHTATAT